MASKSSGKTLADFRALHDRSVVVPNKISAAIATLAKEGPEAWAYESDLIKLAGISQNDMGAYREQFEKHVVLVRSSSRSGERKVWFADPKVAAKVRS